MFMKNSYYILILLLLVVLSGLLQAQPSAAGVSEKTTFSLSEALDFAITNNYTMKNAVLQKGISQTRIGQAKGLLLPQISGNLDMIHNFTVQSTVLEYGSTFFPANPPSEPKGSPAAIQLGLKNQFTPSVTASQALFDMAAFSGLKGARVSREIADKGITQSKIDVIANVTKAYYAVLVSEMQLKSVQKNLQRVDSSYRETVGRFDAGLARKLEVTRIEVSLNNQQEQLLQAISAVDLNRSQLRFQMNASNENPLILTDSLHDGLLTDAVQVLKDKQKATYTDRIEYSINQSQYLFNKLDTKTTNAGHYPRLLAIAAEGYTPAATQVSNIFSEQRRWHPYNYVGLRLQVPIFSGFSLNYRVQEKKLNEQITLNNKFALEKAIDLQVSQALINLNNSMRSFDIQKRNFILADENLRVSRAEYEQGIATNLEVTVAEASLIETQYSYFNALYGVLVSKIDYDKAMGRIK